MIASAPRRLLVLLTAFSSTRYYVAAVPSTLDIITSEDETVIYEDKVTGIWSRNPLTIKSNVPVSVLRFVSDDFRLQGQEPIREDMAHVYVKTNCPNEVNESSIQIGSLSAEKIQVNVKPRPPKHKFLDSNSSSSFAATWDYTSYWCSRQKWLDKQAEIEAATAENEPPRRKLMEVEGTSNGIEEATSHTTDAD